MVASMTRFFLEKNKINVPKSTSFTCKYHKQVIHCHDVTTLSNEKEQQAKMRNKKLLTFICRLTCFFSKSAYTARVPNYVTEPIKTFQFF
jgi:hypothetical protein